jgi:mannosyltransferase OCH1-like enzyme
MKYRARLLTVVNKNNNIPIKKPVEINVKSEEEILKELLDKLVKEKKENTSDKTDDTVDKTDDTVDKTDDTVDKTDDTADKTDDTVDKTDDTTSKQEPSEENNESDLSKEESIKANYIFDNIDKACEFEIQKFIKDCWERSVHYKKNLNLELVKSKIPFNVYQSYSSKTLPKKMELNNALLKISNPELNFILVDFEEQRELIKDNFTQNVLEAYDNLVADEYKNHLWIYCNLYLHGGIYLDINYGNVNNFKLSELVHKNYFVIDKNNSNLAFDTKLMITEPKNIILLKAIDKLVDNVTSFTYGVNSDSVTGSTLLATILHKNEKNMKKVIDSYELAYINSSMYKKGVEILTLYKEYVSEHLDLNPVNKLWTDKMMFKNEKTYDVSKLVSLNENRENSNVFSIVDRIIYMKSVNEELLQDIPMKKLYKIESIKSTNEQLVNATNYLKAIKLAMDNNWSNCLILDGNFQWNSFNESYEQLVTMINQNYDVLVLGGNIKSNPKLNNKLVSLISLHAFVVNSSYYQKLYENMKEVVDKNSLPNNKIMLSVQTNMKKLLKDNWFAMNPLMTQEIK